jgi:hypothetical protein
VSGKSYFSEINSYWIYTISEIIYFLYLIRQHDFRNQMDLILNYFKVKLSSFNYFFSMLDSYYIFQYIWSCFKTTRKYPGDFTRLHWCECVSTVYDFRWLFYPICTGVNVFPQCMISYGDFTRSALLWMCFHSAWPDYSSARVWPELQNFRIIRFEWLCLVHRDYSVHEKGYSSGTFLVWFFSIYTAYQISNYQIFQYLLSSQNKDFSL